MELSRFVPRFWPQKMKCCLILNFDFTTCKIWNQIKSSLSLTAIIINWQGKCDREFNCNCLPLPSHHFSIPFRVVLVISLVPVSIHTIYFWITILYWKTALWIIYTVIHVICPFKILIMVGDQFFLNLVVVLVTKRKPSYNG